MKKILAIFLLTLFTISSVGAIYNPDEPVSSDDISTKILTTTSIKTMHQSWDLNFDGINDCEKAGTCDDSVDYTKAKTYSSSNDFLNAEGSICKGATDGCNSVGIVNGKLGAMTEMYCENIYGINGYEKWSCNSYDQERIKYNKYITANISNLSLVEPVLGGTWYVTEIDWISDKTIVVTYEDGHIQEELTLNKSALILEEEPTMCTMQYDPVCAAVQVQCIRAPCPPIMETFGNACSAGKNEILYKGECDSNFNLSIYRKLQQNQIKVQNILKNLSTTTLQQAYELANTLIARTKMLRIVDWIIDQRVTKFIFLKEMIVRELVSRG